ncbi:serine/threonine-protein kinase [Paenibacillus sp. MMS20-IR301]|uniref:serine/threonine protein kinase n=1 Tax=Paenibacillus sp. MMS20-IR301 TaxID=2895946 RepID=UPI0028EB77E9|nr:serine/threonine-protein kinase [Paenibacillus sp. MMS20-IR301]WNS44992.1 serine/threonine-protein kinase [Paenibacillus sp. MMS20-IR301]
MKNTGKLTAGQILGGRYGITVLIGTGGMSRVYLAEDLRLPGKRWAVKESVIQEGGYSAGAVTAEAELLLSLNHPRLPRIGDFFPPDREGYCYLVMDYIEGLTLQQAMEEHPAALPGTMLLSYARQLLEVLQYLHSHEPPVIYRDLKPANIMLNQQHELMLIDFGIARKLRSGAGEDTEKLGTAGFAAPEQYGGGQSSPRSDLYGLGALLLYLATGGRYSRWQPGMERKLHGSLPDRMIPVIRRLLRHHPEERYASAAEVLAALAPLTQEAAPAKAAHALRGHGQPARPQAYPSPPETAVAAVLGVAQGLGATHTSLAVSSWLARTGRTAWAECSPGAQAFNAIKSLACDAVELSGIAGQREQEQPFTWGGVDYWKLNPGDGLPERPDAAYSFIVLDLGTGGYEAAPAFFAGSDHPILVASGAEWRLEELLHWLRRRGLTPQPDWTVCLPLAEAQTVSLLSALLGGADVRSLPVQPDPFAPKGKLVQAVKELFNQRAGSRLFAKNNHKFQKRS